MRTGEPEAHVDLTFECGQQVVKRQDLPGFQHMRLQQVTTTVAKTATGIISVPTSINALIVNFQGSAIARTTSQGRLILVAPRSVTFVRGGTRLIVTAARGEHVSHVLTWPAGMTPLLEHYVAGTGKGGSSTRIVACKPIDPQFMEAMQRYETARNGSVDYAEPLMLSVVYEIVARLVTGGDEVQLAALPPDLPETIRQLAGKVRSKPSDGWPLKDAADMAGYSPFHFSRVFKQLVGYGFHEYVDRCRTEAAVELLVTTDMAVDLVASTCGFGTTQGLRESIREYLGLVPSELRAVPEAFDVKG